MLRSGIEGLALRGQLPHGADRVATRDEWTHRGAPPQPLGQHLRPGIQPEREPPAIEQPPVARIENGTATRRDDAYHSGGPVRRTEAGDSLSLPGSEAGLALGIEDLRDRGPRPLLDHLVEVDELRLVRGRETTTHGALATARQADKHDVHVNSPRVPRGPSTRQSSPPEPTMSLPVRATSRSSFTPGGEGGGVALRAA